MPKRNVACTARARKWRDGRIKMTERAAQCAAPKKCDNFETEYDPYLHHHADRSLCGPNGTTITRLRRI
jgi:hypothetical protein